MTDEELAEVEIVESAPAEEEAPQETEVVDSESAESAETEKEGSVNESDKTDGVQRRINKITAEKYELREQVEKLQEKLQQFEKQTQPQEPRLDDPDINGDEGIFKQRFAEYLKHTQPTTTAPVTDTSKDEKVMAFSKKVDTFVTEHPDYREVVAKMPIDNDTSDLLLEMDNGPAVAYHLANHLDQLDALSTLPPLQRAMKIQELNNRFEPAKPKQSEAPDPVSSVAGGGGAIDKDPSKMSVEELAAYDEQQWLKRQRG